MTGQCRLIIDPPAPGPWNMAVDETLLMEAADGGVATLRFYQWSEPTLSLGYFQHYADRHLHEASRHCVVVRRQTGGGAILHDRELTYSLTLPASHPLARQTQSLYSAVHDAFIEVIRTAFPTHPPTLIQRDQKSSLEPAAEPFLCFQREAPGDVLVLAGGNAPGDIASRPKGQQKQRYWKILGSAQRRHRGAVLQHGSLLLERSLAAPEIPGLLDLTRARLEPRQIAEAASVPLAGALNVSLSESKPSPESQSNAAALANTKYGGWTWTNRR